MRQLAPLLLLVTACASDAPQELVSGPPERPAPKVLPQDVVRMDFSQTPATTTTTHYHPPTTTTEVVVPATAAPPVEAKPSGDGRLGDPYYEPTWYTLRECEAPDWAGGWQADTGNGFYGGLQFTLSSWELVGGTGYPHEHSPAEQIRRGQMLWERQGWGAWPACSRKLGWR